MQNSYPSRKHKEKITQRNRFGYFFENIFSHRVENSHSVKKANDKKKFFGKASQIFIIKNYVATCIFFFQIKFIYHLLQEYPLSRHEMKRGGSKVQKAPRVQQVQRGYEVQSVQEVQRGYDIPTVQQVQRGYEVPRVQEVQRGYVVPSVQEVQIGYEVPRVLEVQRGYEVPRVQEVQLMYPFISSVETEPSRAQYPGVVSWSLVSWSLVSWSSILEPSILEPSILEQGKI